MAPDPTRKVQRVELDALDRRVAALESSPVGEQVTAIRVDVASIKASLRFAAAVAVIAVPLLAGFGSWVTIRVVAPPATVAAPASVTAPTGAAVATRMP